MHSPSVAVDQALLRSRFVLLRTYDPHGVPIDTPVWFALQGSTLLFRTKRGPKTRRIADRPEVELQACDHRGRPLTAAPIHRGTATELHGDEAETANRVLHRRYGWQWNVIPLIRIPGVVNVHWHLGWRERFWRSRSRSLWPDSVIMAVELSPPSRSVRCFTSPTL